MMIEPPPPAFIMGMQYLVQSIVVVRLASITLCQSSSLTVSGVPGAPMPTLLCRMSSRPYCFIAKSAIASQASALATSPANTEASPPSPLICRASFSARSALRLTSTTLAPSRANRMAVAMPLPTPSPRGAAPVTTATLPFSRSAIAAPYLSLSPRRAFFRVVRRHPQSGGSCHGTEHPGPSLGRPEPNHILRLNADHHRREDEIFARIGRFDRCLRQYRVGRRI